MTPRLHRSRLVALCAALSFLLFTARAANAANDPAPSYPWQEAVWRLAADLRVDDALARLPARSHAGSEAEGRALDYARAVLLLDVQPRRQGNIDQARTLLESVRQTRADDDAGIGALYYLARIAQFHAEPRDPERAASLYEELLASAPGLLTPPPAPGEKKASVVDEIVVVRGPGMPLIQEAVSRLAALRLYADVSPEERRGRFEQFEAAADRLTLPAARRDAHFVLANAFLDLAGDRAGALRHFLAAEEAGIVREQLAADTAVRIALLARDLGRRDVAIVHYKKFLAIYKRDARAYMLGEQLKALEAQAPPPVPAQTPAPMRVFRSADTPPDAVTPAPSLSPVLSTPDAATPTLNPSPTPSAPDAPAPNPSPAPPTPDVPAASPTPSVPDAPAASPAPPAPVDSPTSTPMPSPAP